MHSGTSPDSNIDDVNITKTKVFSYISASKPATQSRKYWANIGKRFFDEDDTATYRIVDVCTYGGKKGRYCYKCRVAVNSDSNPGEDIDESGIDWKFKSCSLLDNCVTTWLD